MLLTTTLPTAYSVRNYGDVSFSNLFVTCYLYLIVCCEQGLVARGRDCYCCFVVLLVFIC